ncbi:hypothetical protein [Nostoc sp. LPT]|nr:hypothetical protein [Nostoc sp. LPT]MBN4001801.1 hypothetical protein [Nostoc sp. LPT]
MQNFQDEICTALSPDRCSTHAVGQMPLHIQLVEGDESVVNELWRE